MARRRTDLASRAADAFARSAALFEQYAELSSAVHQADADLAARVEHARAVRRRWALMHRRSVTGR